MPSPRLLHAAAHTRSEAEARAERFIARQLCALRELGLNPAALAREEALLRGGLKTGALLAGLLDRIAG